MPTPESEYIGYSTHANELRTILALNSHPSVNGILNMADSAFILMYRAFSLSKAVDWIDHTNMDNISDFFAWHASNNNPNVWV